MGRKLIFFVLSLGLAMSLALPMAAAWDSVDEEDDSVPSFAPDDEDEDENEEKDSRADEDDAGVPVFAPEEEVGEEDSRSEDEKTDSAQQREESYAAPVEADQSAGMEPYHPGMMGAQSLVGVSVLGITFVAGMMSIFMVMFGADEIFGWVGLGLVLSGSVLFAPLAVNLVGNIGYPNQFLGGFIGGLAGTVLFYATMIGLEMAPGNTGSFSGPAGLLLYPLATVGGSVIGYHMQAKIRHQRVQQELSRLRLTPAPIVDSARESVGIGLRLQGRF